MQFLTQLTRITNTGQSRSLVLTGNIYDLFYDGQNWVPLTDLLKNKLKVDRTDKQKGITQIVWEVNRPVEVIGQSNLDELEKVWREFHTDTKSLKDRLAETLDNSVYAFEILRQITECARKGKLKNNLLIIVEAADMLLPESPINHMLMQDRKRVSIVHDMFSDPEFVNGHDAVILMAESRSGIHSRISRLPQVMSVEIDLPDRFDRWNFILHHPASSAAKKEHHCELADKLADQTAGLSLHAINQLLLSGDFSPTNIVEKVEDYMESQLGEGVVEFKRPTHTLEDVIGFSMVKKFINEELIPGFMRDGSDCLSGALVAGPIGGGKSYICEAVAGELSCPVIVLKNIRSKWYGETDQIFERFKRLVKNFYKLVVFVDEADAMFGSISSDQDVERRLTGQTQAMMSDPALRGHVIWFLMTARPHLLSPDIRRPGRMDLILPILDPTGTDFAEFMKWTFGQLYNEQKSGEIYAAVRGYSAAEFGALRTAIKAKKCQTIDEAIAVAEDLVPADISEVRKYQILQAKMNCTRKSLLYGAEEKVSREAFLSRRADWQQEINKLESKGIK
jgi:hypothetical protein